MRYNSFISEFISSIKRVGVLNTFQLAYSRFTDKKFDDKYKIDTSKRLEIDELDINSESPEVASRGQMYQPTGVLPFKKIMKRIQLPKDPVFVDYGCGKGRTLALAMLQGIKKVVGVEFSKQLCDDAIENLNRIKKENNLSTTIKVDCIDASVYKIKEDENLFYFFYPFDELITKKVINNIINSYKECKREIKLIYYYPIHRQIIEGFPEIKIEDEFTYFGYDCIIYVLQ